MKNLTQPSKEQVRQWLLSRHNRRMPLPELDEVRRQVGWTGSSTVPPICKRMSLK